MAHTPKGFDWANAATQCQPCSTRLAAGVTGRQCVATEDVPTIEELLQRRNDLSTFLVHFTRDYEGVLAKDNLLSILRDLRVEARNPFGMARSESCMQPQRCVCFTETPLEHAWMMCVDIAGRQVHFGGYGIAFTKAFARRNGVNPVWYVDITTGHEWLSNAIRRMVEDAVRAANIPGPRRTGDNEPADADIFCLTPFIEEMGKQGRTRKEFWWEREWRRVGDLTFTPADVVVVAAPEREHDELRAQITQFPEFGDRVPPVIDVAWGLERIVAALAGVMNAGPFPDMPMPGRRVFGRSRRPARGT